MPEVWKLGKQKRNLEQEDRATTEQAVIAFCQEPRSVKEIMEHLGYKHREHFRSEVLVPLIEANILKQTLPDKPNSPKQKQGLFIKKYQPKIFVLA